MDRTHFYEPEKGHGLTHDPFKAILAPRPIGWISTCGPTGIANLAPYSFFAPISDAPPMLMFASQGWKDTVANAQRTGQFVWNMVSRDLLDAMNRSAEPVCEGIDEFELAGLEKSPGVNVDIPSVAISPVAMECRVLDIRQLFTLDGEGLQRWTITGQVVGIHIRDGLQDDGLFDTAGISPVSRGGYRDQYFAADPQSLIRLERRD